MHGALLRLFADPKLWIEPVATFATTVLISLLVRHFLLHALRVWATRTNSGPGLIWFRALRVPTLIGIAILGVHFAIQVSTLPEAIMRFGPTVLAALWIVFFTVMCMGLARDLARHYGQSIPGAQRVTSLTQNLAQGAVVTIGALWMLKLFGVGITPLLTALGVGGLAVALALQDTLSNFFAGFYVAVARQVRIGDYIKLNTGEEGYVADITWRSTIIRSPASYLIIVPNTKLAQANVTNYHLPAKPIVASLQVTVSYDADPDQIERLLLEVARHGTEDIPGMLAEQPPSAAFDPGFGESGLGFTLSFQVAEFTTQYGVRNELRKRILRRFRQEGIAIPFPTRTIRVEGGAGPENPRASL
ncbi:MAG TPA: mechanosensitive ion channel family protein [Bryobacteraceae bacterium]|nr:mechanosensitive ion channel family protein [Bryobacteraceae bacterium]